jgi:predicted ATP-binding protein involved in virulence
MADQAPNLGHLAQVEVRGLFGDRRFRFDLDRREPTLLTGSNGTGKSTILRIIDAIGTGEWHALVRLPFTIASLEFESGETFVCHRSHDAFEVTCDGLSAALPFFDLDEPFDEDE